MKLTEAGLDIIKVSEGLRLQAYLCPAKVLTIGYGHTSMAGKPEVKPNMTITKEEAEAILLRDLVKYEDAVKRLVKVPLNDNQYSALVSLCYNIGEGNLAKSTVIARVNAKDFSGAAKAFAKWNRAGGKVLPGLTKRRQVEADLFMNPIVIPSHPPIPEKPMGLLAVILNVILSFFKVSK